MSTIQATPQHALSAWTWDGPVSSRRHDAGLINDSFWVLGPAGPRAVLQRLNTQIFGAEVHEDIEAITTRLTERKVPTPRLLRTTSGALWHTATGGSVWRCLTLVGDRTVHRVEHPDQARSAAALVARFHGAVRDLDWRFRSVRPGAHDTEAHMAALARAVDGHPQHRLYDEVLAEAKRITEGWAGCPRVGEQPGRIVHGDLKISNVRFTGDEATALIDLDTLAHGTLALELGDALRSWCNPASEDADEAVFDLAVFEAAMEGYAAAAGEDGPHEPEWAAIVPSIQRICWELAARFARDALEEAYFGWSPQFGGRGEHNLLRARGQASLAEAVRRDAGRAEAALHRAR